MKAPGPPSAEDRADIKAEFKLDDAQQACLWEVVDWVVERCTRHASFESKEPSREDRVKALRNLNRDVERLKETIKRTAPILGDLLRTTTYADLGGFFTSAAMSEITGEGVGPDVPFRLMKRAAMKHFGMCNSAVIDRLTSDDRREIGKIYGQRLVESVLDAISKPVSAQVAVERANRGERELFLYRNYLIQEVGRSYFRSLPRLRQQLRADASLHCASG
jgi:hypothetical protein